MGTCFFMKLFIPILLLAVAFVVFIRMVESSSVFYPSTRMEFTPADIGLSYEDIYFDTADGIRLNGWLLKDPQAKATVIFCHGNAGNISGRLEKIKLFLDMGLNVLIFDYRGYGRSQGKPTEPGVYKDAQAAYAFLQGRKDLASLPVIIYGSSLGGAIAIDLASKEQAACLIVDSTFSSAKDMAKRILPMVPGFLIKTKLDSVSKVKQITIPKLFMHSPQDDVVPFSLGKKLFEAAAAPKTFKEMRGDHNSGYAQNQPLFIEPISDFLRDLNIL